MAGFGVRAAALLLGLSLAGCGPKAPPPVVTRADAAVDELAFGAALRDAGAQGEAWAPILERRAGEVVVYVALPLSAEGDRLALGQAVAVRVEDGRAGASPYLGEAHISGLLGGAAYEERPRGAGVPADQVGAAVADACAAWASASNARDFDGAVTALLKLSRVLPLDAWGAPGQARPLLRRVAAGELQVGHSLDPSRATPTVVLVLGEERRTLPIVEIAPGSWALGAL